MMEKKLEEMKELSALCEPLVKYLRENYNPYTEIAISPKAIVVRECVMGIPMVANHKD